MNAPDWRLLAIAAALVGAWLFGQHVGAAGVQSDWEQDKAAQAETLRLARLANARAATDAAAGFEAYRARNAAALVNTRTELRQALQRPICPLGGDFNHATLADLPVPAAAVERLRRAAAGGGAP